MKAGIVGCGLNSDYHIRFAKEYPGIEITGVVDQDIGKARECAAKHGIPRFFSSIKELVDHQKPDVIHVVTPPRTHFQVAKEALELGCNILVEKPIALNAEEARELYALAEHRNLSICPMHNHYFDPCMVKARGLIESGAAGRIVNIESYYGINSRIDAFRRYPLPNVLPWLYNMPGGVYHDFMPHPVYVMFPYIGKVQDVHVMEKSFGELPQGISDELRILVKGDKAFGVLTFSLAAKPHMHFIRYYGTKMLIEVNIDTMTTVCHPVSGLPKAAQKATFNLSESWQLFTRTVSNVWNFGRGKLRPYQGMRTLMHGYYDALGGKGGIPVPKDDALSVVETMDRIWPQIRNRYLNFENHIPAGQPAGNDARPKILVTGATGFLGKRLVEILLQKGYRVRALARKLSSTDRLKNAGAEVYFGDVGSVESLRPAFEGIDVVVHAAADTAGRKEESEIATIQGTKNVIDLCRESNVDRIVYISSCSVYGVADYKENAVVTEESSLERFPERRGYYSEAKLEAEKIVTEAMSREGLRAICLRPGTYFGPGGDFYTPMMGLSFGEKLFLVIGNGKFVLPLIYIDNLVDAIVAVIEKDEGIGKIYNVVDTDTVSKRIYVDSFMRKLFPGARFLYIPYGLFYFMIYMQEKLTGLLKMKPFLTRYRLVSSQKNILYSSEKIRRELDWTPPFGIREGMDKVAEHHEKSL